MKNLGQFEAAMICASAREMSPHVGAVVPAYSSLLDGPGGDQLLSPTRREHWPHVLPGIGMPQFWLPCDEASGNLIDRGLAGLTFTATGLTYQQTVAGSSLQWATAAQSANNGARIDTLSVGPDPGQPLFIVFDFRATATGGARTLFTISPNVIIQLTTGGLLSMVVSGSTTVNGTVDLRSASARHRLVMYWEPGDTVGGGPILRLWTRHETIAVTAGSGPGGVLAFAGAGAFGIGGTVAPPALTFRGLGVWTGASARRAANLGGARQGGKTLLVASGATVLY